MTASKSNDGTPQYSQLWPTQFMSLRLPGNESANSVLADFVLAQNVNNDDITVITNNNSKITTPLNDHTSI